MSITQQKNPKINKNKQKLTKPKTNSSITIKQKTTKKILS